MEIKVNLDELTYGQAEFLEEYAGLGVDEMLAAVQSGEVTVKMAVGLLAMQLSPHDPEAGLAEARSLKIAETLVTN